MYAAEKEATSSLMNLYSLGFKSPTTRLVKNRPLQYVATTPSKCIAAYVPE